MTTTKDTGEATPRARLEWGRSARSALPPGDQGDVIVASDRPDPVALLQKQAVTRVPELVPIRHARMMVSPFTFYRGNAQGMAIDLGAAPTSGIKVQVCGDAHLSNFGLFASPERRLLFDINDFDETMPGPWEWDVKRLAASMVVAGRANGFSHKERRKCVRATVRRYRDATAGFATMGVLDVWYARVDADSLQDTLTARLDKRARKVYAKTLTKARASDRLKAAAKMTEVVDGRARIAADPPVVVPVQDLLPDRQREQLQEQMEGLLAGYRRTLQPDRRALLDQFRFIDLARKVVGVGSVGTRCWIALLEGRDQADPLLLQIKEAGPSVLKAHVPAPMRVRNAPRNQGERVVLGQRQMQAASDIFLGWQRVEGIDGKRRDFYVRQLRDMKGSAAVETMVPAGMTAYGEACGWTLARAHARSGDAVAIAGYLGDDDAFPDAMVAYAEQYADQNERDYARFCEGVKAGSLDAQE
jgi:uncharacterized protein (DUF2252 family)